ncbi:hypothetical protein CLOM_g6629 [Closterium sp. NIES-68]|nr:hypothetical protein CLOM_g6629 [Closterium sp. NIES-68]
MVPQSASPAHILRSTTPLRAPKPCHSIAPAAAVAAIARAVTEQTDASNSKTTDSIISGIIVQGEPSVYVERFESISSASCASNLEETRVRVLGRRCGSPRRTRVTCFARDDDHHDTDTDVTDTSCASNDTSSGKSEPVGVNSAANGHLHGARRLQVLGARNGTPLRQREDYSTRAPHLSSHDVHDRNRVFSLSF